MVLKRVLVQFSTTHESAGLRASTHATGGKPSWQFKADPNAYAMLGLVIHHAMKQIDWHVLFSSLASHWPFGLAQS